MTGTLILVIAKRSTRSFLFSYSSLSEPVRFCKVACNREIDVCNALDAVVKLTGVDQGSVSAVGAVEAVGNLEAGKAGALAPSFASSFARAFSGLAGTYYGLSLGALALAFAFRRAVLIPSDHGGRKPSDKAVELLGAAVAISQKLVWLCRSEFLP